jgi:hypothetical protein
MAARELGHQDLVSLLLRHGAFVDTIDKVMSELIASYQAIVHSRHLSFDTGVGDRGS